MAKIAIRTYLLRIEADLAKLRLDSLGVKSEVVALDGVFSGVLGGFELRVDSGQQQRSLKFIEEYEESLKQATPDELPDEFENDEEESDPF